MENGKEIILFETKDKSQNLRQLPPTIKNTWMNTIIWT